MDRRTYETRRDPDPRKRNPFEEIADALKDKTVSDALASAPYQKTDAVKAAVVFTADQVRSAWAQSDLSHLEFISTNKQYRALPLSDWDSILDLHFTEHTYEPDFFDCDAFSAVFVGDILWNYEINGVVRVFDNGAHHSYNGVLVANPDGSCSWQKVEPQADYFVDRPPAGLHVLTPKGAYSALKGFAITA